MNRGQTCIFNELQNARRAYLNILTICRTKRPLNHKNAAAIKSEIHSGLRHMDRMQKWTTEQQDNQETYHDN